MTISDNFLILATILGPVFAVQAQNFLERAGEKRKRKLHIFLHRDNLYQSCDENDKIALKSWLDKCDLSFSELMYNMSQTLGYDFDRVQLKRGMYYSRKQVETETAQQAVLHNSARVLTGQQYIAMNVIGFPVDKEAAELQTKVQNQYLKAFTGETAFNISIKS